MEEELSRLLKLVNDLSPMVYEAAQKQVYVNLMLDLLFLFLFGSIMFLYIRFIKKRNGIEAIFSSDNGADLFIVLFGGLGALSSGLLMIPILIEIVNILVNPQWQIIRLIVGH